MTDAISSVSSSSSSKTSSTSSVLSNDTKAKLKALGLDPTKYTSESAAQEAITEAQEKQQQKTAAPKSDGSSFTTIKTEVQDLAAKIGITVGTNDKTSDILTKISDQITELKSAAGTDSSKLSAASAYESQYTTISSELSQLESAKNMTGASALANYNKAALGLAA